MPILRYLEHMQERGNILINDGMVFNSIDLLKHVSLFYYGFYSIEIRRLFHVFLRSTHQHQWILYCIADKIHLIPTKIFLGTYSNPIPSFILSIFSSSKTMHCMSMGYSLLAV